MKYTIGFEFWPGKGKTPGMAEAEQILDFVLGQIQKRRGSPDLDVLAVIYDDGSAGPFAIISLNKVSCHNWAVKRIATMGFWGGYGKSTIMIVNLIKYAPRKAKFSSKRDDNESYGYYHRTDLTLHASDSIDRIRGMIDLFAFWLKV